jgi:uncharacterized membrane protein
MAVGRDELWSWLPAAGLILVWAVVSHYLVGIYRAAAWIDWLNLIQHVGMNLVFGAVFGRSLLGGRQPLVTLFASHVYKTMTPLLLRYTRQVTLAWTSFFVLMAALSILLFFLAPIEVWSAFANILPVPLVALMFIAENEARKRMLPPEDQIGILAAFRAFRAAWRS